jgi:hypothetical protein
MKTAEAGLLPDIRWVAAVFVFGACGGGCGEKTVTKHRDGKKQCNLEYAKNVPRSGFSSVHHV